MRIRPTVKEMRRLQALVDSFEAACIERQGKIENLERDKNQLQEGMNSLKGLLRSKAPSPAPAYQSVVDYSKVDLDLLVDYARAVLSSTDDDLVEDLEAQCREAATFCPHSQQQIVKDSHGVLRFRRNAVVDRLVNEITGGLNYVMTFDAPREDFAQLAQLIGYSVSGYQSLSYALPVQGYDE
jgi:hypothetical protein